MNKTMKSLILTLSLLLASIGFAQTSLTETTASTALSQSQTAITLGSITGLTAGQIVFVEDGTVGSLNRTEAMFVVSVPSSGTTIQVVRGYDQTIPQAHINGVPVIYGPAAAFYEVEPSGACTPGNQQYTPYINLRTGNQWLCSSITNSWVPGFFNVDAPLGVTAAVASVAGATNPSGPLFHITGTNAITAWGSSTTVGMLGGAGSKTDVVGAPFCIIPDALFTVTATNNIALASSAVVNKLLCYTFDQTNKKYVPSY